MEVKHKNFSHMANKDSSAPQREIPVHHVMMPEDEGEFMEEMQKVLNAPPPQDDDILSDDVIKQELNKKRTLEKLVLFKQPVYKEIELAGVTFKLKLLNVHESNNVARKLQKMPEEDGSPAKFALVLLSTALVSIDGIPLEDTYSGPDDITDPVMKRYYEMCSWPMTLINTLVEAQQNFIKETNEGLSKDFLGPSRKTQSTD